jgi:hypothetical protein
VPEQSTELGHRIKFHEAEVVAKTSGYMSRLVQEATEIKLHPDNINRLEGLKLSKAWNPSTSLLALRHSNTYTSQKSTEDTEKSMQKRKQNSLTTGTPASATR